MIKSYPCVDLEFSLSLQGEGTARLHRRAARRAGWRITNKTVLDYGFAALIIGSNLARFDQSLDGQLQSDGTLDHGHLLQTAPEC